MPIQGHKVLAIDASTEQSSVALHCNGRIRSSACDIPKSHAQALLPMVDQLMSDAGIALSQLDAIVVTLGPGSFTGVRICLSVAQGLAYGAKVPLIGANSLEVLAQGVVANKAFESPKHRHVVSCLDARMSEVYWAGYKFEEGRLVEIAPPSVVSPSQFNASVAPYAGNAIAGGHGLGVDIVDADAFNLCLPDELPLAKNVLSIWCDDGFNTALELARKKGIGSIEPLYLRNEVAWEKRTRIRTP
ncbi:MAG: tRNA (adenosine(37)-N6)-threonylcarbamoyltransferase complex dimerization subunit type 1 TsaB [Agarilytica sp.]